MNLSFGQLICTSFYGTGVKILASEQVPASIQQIFMQRVVSQYWDSYNPPPSGYRAVYLYQATLKDCLFGWLYNDGADEINRTHVPYFICYYLAEPLQTAQLENIFTFLHRGPVALVDRQNPPSVLETVVAPDLWNYQPTRPGVAIPSAVSASSYIALKQGERLDLFVPVNEQEISLELNAKTDKQQAADLSIYTRYLIEAIEMGVVDLIDLDDAATIEARVIKPYQEYKEKLQRYEQALVEAIRHEYPINHNTRKSLKLFQQSLQLKDEDIEIVEVQVAQQLEAVEQRNKAVPVDAYPSVQNTRYNSTPAYRNSQLLLKAGIAATVLALFGSIYGFLETSNFDSSKPGFISSPPSSVPTERK